MPFCHLKGSKYPKEAAHCTRGAVPHEIVSPAEVVFKHIVQTMKICDLQDWKLPLQYRGYNGENIDKKLQKECGKEECMRWPC